jgi:hypothetical protein
MYFLSYIFMFWPFISMHVRDVKFITLIDSNKNLESLHPIEKDEF